MAVAAKQRLVLVALGLVVIAVVAVLAFLKISGGSADLSGVWRTADSNETFVIDKHDDSYRLSVDGRRLLVKAVEKDSLTHAVNLTVHTDSGLLAIWSFRQGTDAGGLPTLHLDRDGFVQSDLQLQRQLTAVDRSRLAQLKPAKKAVWSPAFDCGKAGTDVERMICSDRNLAAQDARLAVYMKLPGSDIEAQKMWLHDVRDSCKDVGCVSSAYQQRLDQVGLTAGSVDTPQPEPADAAPAPDNTAPAAQ
jgi:hypothetical protein